MDLRNISQVGHTDRQEDVNRMLREGWVLLATQGGVNDEGQPVFWHALGLPEDPVALAIDLLRNKERTED
ncbi:MULTISPECIES: hypothetical protein [Stenotrophomonas maltophilia group]|nr:hypothetical protein [Stenotrophomonas maltophilia]